MTDNLLTDEQAKAFLKANNCKTAEDIANSLIKHYGKLLEKALEEEMTDHLGYSKYDWKNKNTDNSRGGHSKKTIQSQFGKTKIKIPRDTNGEFEPQTVKKYDTQISMDDRIISMYAKGMSDRDINAHMLQTYGANVSPTLVSNITDKILPIAKEWQNRPLESIYPIIYMDGIEFKIRDSGKVTPKTVYIVFGITIEGKKDILGLWIGEHETSKFWMNVLSDIKERGVEDILIASVDGLNGFEEAIKAIFPQTEIQKCIVHQIRTATKFVSYKDRKEFCGDMKLIYKAINEEEALKALDNFEDKWKSKYAYAIKSWRSNWPILSTFFKFPAEIRRIIYTTNQIESLNRRIRKVTKTKSSFPTEDSVFKLIYLIIQDYINKWTMPIRNWSLIFNQLSIYFGERITKYI